MSAFRDFFSAQSESYAQFRPHYPAPLYHFLADESPHHRLAWDVGTGNGQAAIGLAAHFEKVRATDASETQIDRAIKNDRVDYAVAPANESGLASESAALTTAAQCLHWFASKSFYDEVFRVLAPGGLLATWAYGFHRSGETHLDEIMLRFATVILAEYWPSETKLIWNGYRDLEFPFAEIATPSISLDVPWNLHELIGLFSSWSATQKFREQRGFHPVETVGEELLAAWGDPEMRRTLRCPLVFRAGRAR